MASNVGGFIKFLFLALGNHSAFSRLHLFFGNMRGVGSGFGSDKELTALARHVAPKLNEGEAVGVGVLLLRSVRRPKAAVAFEAWVAKNLDLTPHDPASSASEKVLRPGDTFEATITPAIQGLANWAWNQVEKSPASADSLAFLVAEDANWHAIEGVSDHSDDSTPLSARPRGSLVRRISQELDYGLEDVAAFIVALLRLAGLKSLAERVKKQALREFAQSYNALARVAARVLESGTWDKYIR